jgi:hypothetical protein
VLRHARVQRPRRAELGGGHRGHLQVGVRCNGESVEDKKSFILLMYRLCMYRYILIVVVLRALTCNMDFALYTKYVNGLRHI